MRSTKQKSAGQCPNRRPVAQLRASPRRQATMDVGAGRKVVGDLDSRVRAVVTRASKALAALLALLGAVPCALKAQDCKWSPLVGATPGGISFAVTDLSVFDDGTGPALYAGGVFEQAGGLTTNNIAKWN